jgi:hypothetical protein
MRHVNVLKAPFVSRCRSGSNRMGRIAMTKAAKHITPVALELGSKCPCIVDWLDGKRDSQVHMPLFFLFDDFTVLQQ